jgi:hypothetical protein
VLGRSAVVAMKKRGPVPRPWPERLWRRIDCSGGPDACWFWTGGTSNGYGRLCIESGHMEYTHRLAYEDRVGPVPLGLILLHTCEGRYPAGDQTHRRCCNPSHLRPGTYAENAADALNNGRPGGRRGSMHQFAKLSSGQIDEIRKIGSSESQRTLGARYGVSHTRIGAVLRGDAYRDV